MLAPILSCASESERERERTLSPIEKEKERERREGIKGIERKAFKEQNMKNNFAIICLIYSCLNNLPLLKGWPASFDSFMVICEFIRKKNCGGKKDIFIVRSFFPV